MQGRHRDISGLTKLHIGCGGDFKGDYINIDLYDDSVCDLKLDVVTLEGIPDNFADEVFHMHLLEHLTREQGKIATKNWYRVLKPGGKLEFEMPEADETFRMWLAMDYHQRWEQVQNLWHGYNMQLFGSQDTPGQQHYILYDKERTKRLLEEAGFSSVTTFNIDDPWLKENQHVIAIK